MLGSQEKSELASKLNIIIKNQLSKICWRKERQHVAAGPGQAPDLILQTPIRSPGFEDWGSWYLTVRIKCNYNESKNRVSNLDLSLGTVTAQL